MFAITKALVDTALKDGVKADASLLGTVMLDLAQAAYRKTLPSLESDIIALAHALSANPLVTVAAELVVEVIEKATGTTDTTSTLDLSKVA